MSQPTAIRNLWYRWKALRLPWRRKWLCGFDLQGNTFWEFQNALAPGGRPRRIAKYPRATHHGDVHLTPAWLQWLRHTRNQAPSVQEQHMELQRQDQLKELAQQADRRWEEKESYLDSPEKMGQTAPALRPGNDVRKDPGGLEEVMSPVTSEREQVKGTAEVGHKGDTAATQEEKRWQEVNRKDDPWKRPRGAPSEGWQPKAWTPGKSER